MAKTKKKQANSTKKQTKRIFFSYSDENMQKAVQAVKENSLSKKQAARQFGVPRSTLIRKLSGAVPLQRKMGPQSELSETEENTLVTWILAMAKKGFPVHKQNLLLSVKKFLEDNGREIRYLKESKTPGRSWFEGFLKRHPEIKEKNAESVSKARAAVTQDRIHGWFDEISDHFKEKHLESILLDPSRIFNGDESGFVLCPKSGKVLGPAKTTEDFYERVSSEKEQITVMATFSANGTVVPPMLIFPYKKMPKAIVESIPENWALGRSDSGWINSEVFYEYLSNHFIPFVKSSNIDRPVVLFVDGHRSHLTQQASLLCDENGIILISLLPNTTHIMQPADVAVFKPLKSGWKSAVRTWKFQNFPKEVNRYTFGTILKAVFDQFATATTIQNGFRKSGLFPFDKNNVDYTKCIPNRIITSENILNEYNTNNTAIKTIEGKIEKEELDQFLQTYRTGAAWTGNIESVNLYKVWCAIRNDNNPTSSQDMSSVSQKSDNLSLAEENMDVSTPRADAQEPYNAREVSPIQEQPSTSSQWQTPKDATKKYYESKEGEGYKIPSPFKKCLVFPNSNPTEIKTPKRKRKIFPAVVSSGKYREFYKNEETKKLLPKTKNKKKLRAVIESSDSDVSVRYNDEDLDVSDLEDLDLTVGKFVIIKYENNHYPGVILKSDVQGAQIRSMVTAGLMDSWKWPVKDDILYYFREDIVCNIAEPKQKNQRGHYSVPKM